MLYHSIRCIHCVLIHISTENVELYTDVDSKHGTAIHSCQCPCETCNQNNNHIRH